MPYDPHKHHRRSIRLQDYDYTAAGAYFVTICAQGRQCLFGEIVDGRMRSDAAGRMVQTVWDELSIHYLGVDTDAFVVMPNHIHGIIVLHPPSVGADPRVRPDDAPPTDLPPKKWFFRKFRAHGPTDDGVIGAILGTPPIKGAGVPSCRPQLLGSRAVRLTR